MANFIISPLAISFESIKNNLQTFAQSLSQDKTWQDYYASSTGETIIEIIAALGAFYAYHSILGRRESYLSTAQNYSSIVGLAQNNGYSCYRGNNIKVTLKVLPKQLPELVTIHKWDVIGEYGGSSEYKYDLVAMNDEPIVIGGSRPREIEIPVVIGDIKEQTVNINTSDITTFSFYNDSITEDFRLLLDDQVVPTSDIVIDALKDKYITVSNSYGGIDVFYLQKGDYQYVSGNTLVCQFIEKNDIEAKNLNISGFACTIDINGVMTEWTDQINKVSVTTPKIDKEASKYIKVRAPLFHETSMVIRSRKDYSKYLLLKNPELIEVNDRDINPGLIEITYLKEDHSPMTDLDKEKYLELIEESRPTGVAKAIISEPLFVSKHLVIKLWKTSDEDFAPTINSDIDKILKQYTGKFEQEVDLDQIEHDIEKISGVKIARVEWNESTDESAKSWQGSTTFYNYDIITTDYGNFYVNNYLKKSGTTDPSDWSSKIGDIILDNNLVWECVNTFESTVVHNWKPNTAYNKYDYVKWEVLNDSEEYGSSGTTPPLWGEETIQDGYVTWQLISESDITEEDEVTSWLPSTVFYKNRSIVKISTIIDSESIELYYKCISCRHFIDSNIYMVKNFREKSGEITPDGSAVFNDNLIVWTLQKQDSNVDEDDEDDVNKWKSGYNKWVSDTYYCIGDEVKVKVGNDYYYYIVTSLVGNTSQQEPDWQFAVENSGQVEDNDIVWNLMKSDNKSINLKWNEILNLTYELRTMK